MTTQIRSLNSEEKSTQADVLKKAATLIKAKPPLSEKQIQQIYDKLREHYDQADHVNGLGVAFGELLIKQSGYQWASLKYDEGHEVCVVIPGTQVFCAPISMMTKRVHKGERTDIAALCRETIATMKRKVKPN